MTLSILAVVAGFVLSYLYGGKNRKKDKDVVDAEYKEKDVSEEDEKLS